jgi:hypothetical protein
MDVQALRVFAMKGIYRRRGDVRRRLGGHTTGRRGQGVGRATPCYGRLLALLRLFFGLRLRVSKIEISAFVSSNSKNISCVTFLKHKNSRKEELALWHVVNRLVPEKCIKTP